MTEHIDHTDVEVADGEEAPTSPQEPRPGGQPTLRDVIKAAIAQRLPCASCGSLEACRCIPVPEVQRADARADLIEHALIHYGHISDRATEPRVFDPEETAKWLANRSGFARYTQVQDGWRRLVEAETDVVLASIKALQRVPSEEFEIVKAAKAALLSWHQQQV